MPGSRRQSKALENGREIDDFKWKADKENTRDAFKLSQAYKQHLWRDQKNTFSASQPWTLLISNQICKTVWKSQMLLLWAWCCLRGAYKSSWVWSPGLHFPWHWTRRGGWACYVAVRATLTRHQRDDSPDGKNPGEDLKSTPSPLQLARSHSMRGSFSIKITLLSIFLIVEEFLLEAFWCRIPFVSQKSMALICEQKIISFLW